MTLPSQRLSIPLVSVLLVASCSPAAMRDEAGAAQTAGPTSDTTEAVFVMRNDSRVVGVDRFVRTEGSLQGEVMSSGEGIEYEAELRPDGTVSRLELRRFSESLERPSHTLEIDLRGDTAVARLRGEDSRVWRIPNPEDAIPAGEALAMSVANWEQVLRRARHMGGESVEVPLLSVGDSETIPVTVTFFGPDSARIGLGGESLSLRIDEDRILSGGMPEESWRFERMTPAEADAVTPADWKRDPGR